MTMFYYLFLLCFLFNFLSAETANPCVQLNQKLTRYHLPRNDFPALRVCQSSLPNHCCPPVYEVQIRNNTALELYQLFELSTISLYESLIRSINELNNTYIDLINISRNETHLVLERGYNKLYHSYRLSVDTFFNNLLKLTSRTYQVDLKNSIEQLFRQILHISLTLNNNQTIRPSYFSCLWKNHPFANNPNLIENQLEIHLGKIFQLKDLLKLSHDLVQILSTSVTTDSHCIDSYMQLSYCNLCGGRRELPCLSNCIHVMRSCLINTTLIDDVWRDFLDALENSAYFENIEKVLSSVGLSISDAVMTFFNSAGVQNKAIIDQCGHIRIRRQTPSIHQKIDGDYSKTLSLSVLDRQLNQISRLLQMYRLFWMKLPEQVCQATGIAARNGTMCWTGTAVSQNGRSSIPAHYEKPLSLKLQRILREMRDKSQTIGNIPRTTSALKIDPTIYSSLTNDSKSDLIVPNFTDTLKSTDLDDYPNDNEFDYSDYAYEDSTDQTSTTITSSTSTTPTTTTTTRRPATTTPIDEEIPVDDTNTVYYDYGDHDLYSDDDESEDSSVTEESVVLPTTTRMLPPTTTPNWKDRIPYHHRRPAIIWNVNDDDENSEKQEQRPNSGSSLHYSLLIFLSIVLSRV